MLQDQLREARDGVSTMRKLHEFAQSQLFELRAQSGWFAAYTSFELCVQDMNSSQAGVMFSCINYNIR